MPDLSPSNVDSLKLTARKKEWWPATADSLPQPVTCQHCDSHYVSKLSNSNYQSLKHTPFDCVIKDKSPGI